MRSELTRARGHVNQLDMNISHNWFSNLISAPSSYFLNPITCKLSHFIFTCSTLDLKLKQSIIHHHCDFVALRPIKCMSLKKTLHSPIHRYRYTRHMHARAAGCTTIINYVFKKQCTIKMFRLEHYEYFYYVLYWQCMHLGCNAETFHDLHTLS